MRLLINPGYPGKVAGALQIDAFQMIKAFCKPRIKVGTEWVIKGQVSNSFVLGKKLNLIFR